MTTLGDYWHWEHVGRDQARRDWDAEGPQVDSYDLGLREVLSPPGYWDGYDSELSSLVADDGDRGMT